MRPAQRLRGSVGTVDESDTAVARKATWSITERLTRPARPCAGGHEHSMTLAASSQQVETDEPGDIIGTWAALPPAAALLHHPAVLNHH